MMWCKIIFGSLVADYQDGENWVDFTMLDVSSKDLNKLLNVFFLDNDEDSLIQKDNPNGQFSVSSLYRFSFDECQEPIWAKAWFKGMTPKINIFLWILLQDKILTIDNLKKKGL